MTIVQLETARLVLEPLTSEHARALFAEMSDPILYEFTDSPPPDSVEALEDQFRRWESRKSPDGSERWLNWAVKARDGRYVGWIQSSLFDNGSAALAYMIFGKNWRRGYATEACLRVLDHLYGDFKVSLVWATVDEHNEASIRLLDRLGFTRVSTRVVLDFLCETQELRYEKPRTVG